MADQYFVQSALVLLAMKLFLFSHPNYVFTFAKEKSKYPENLPDMF